MTWSDKFGDDYTVRNIKPVDYVSRYGKTREEMFSDIFGNLNREYSVLEIGCNVGNQLEVLQNLGFSKLQGIDINNKAVEEAISRGFDVRVGNAKKIEAYDREYDIVFTSGLLIHVSPQDLPIVLREICRVSCSHVAGFEYYSEKFERVAYRDGVGLWKGDYASEYVKHCGGRMAFIKEKFYPYLDGSGNVDSGFLLARI